jgi:hypothetical protein
VKLTILREADVEATATHAAPVAITGLRASKRLSPEGYALWLCVAELDAGGTCTWGEEHGDEALYVLDGELALDGHACPTGGAVMVEAGVAATVTATRPTTVAHYGSTVAAPPGGGPLGPAAPGGHRVHVVGPRGIAAFGDPDDVGARFLADARCPTCRLALFEVTRRHLRPGRPHSHSADEIIFVTAGSMQLGAHVLGPGTALSIPGGVRYAEGSGPDGCTFLNYRRDVSDRTDFVAGQAPSTNWETAGDRRGVRVEDDVVHVGPPPAAS